MNNVDTKWLYAGIVAIVLNVLYVVYAARTRWGGSDLYRFANDRRMVTLFLSVLVTVLILMYTAAALSGLQKSAVSSMSTHFVVTAGTYFNAAQLPFTLGGIYQRILEIVVFTGDPITYLILAPVIFLYTGASFLIQGILSGVTS